jgi:hypothetical protein
MNCNLVIQSYGNETEYKRGIFSILSFFAWSKQAISDLQVILFTDNTDYFNQYLSGLPIKYIELNKEKIKSMRGTIDFVHRVKIVVIQEAFQHCKDNMIYLDSDTCFIKEPETFLKDLNDTQAFMHQYEYQFKEMLKLPLPAGKIFHDFYNYIHNRTFYTKDNKSFQISSEQVSWNAGVIVLNESHQRILADVLKLTDDLYPYTKHHGCEQYAFNHFIEEIANIKSAEEIVFHYWPVVQKKIADTFFAKRLTSTWNKQDLNIRLKDVKNWTLLIPDFIKNHFLYLRNESILSFHNKEYLRGYYFAFRALLKDPFDFKFYKDVFYHTKRIMIFGKRK